MGNRLAAAAGSALGAGAEAVVLIGGDCPYIETSHLKAAAVMLERTDVVIGPARDGGYYLIGVRRLERAMFTGIAWSSALVLVQARERCAAAGLSVVELGELEDVDDEASWRRAAAAGVLG